MKPPASLKILSPAGYQFESINIVSFNLYPEIWVLHLFSACK